MMNKAKELIETVKDIREPQMFEYVEEHKESIEKVITDSDDKKSPIKKTLNDHYGNTLTSTGNDDKVTSFTNYGMSNDTLNFTLWMALYNDSWVFRRAIDKPAEDEIRCGVTLGGEQDKDSVYKLLNKYRTDLIDILKWGALFGGSIGVMMFDNLKDEDYSKSLSDKQIKDAKALRIYTVDRWYGVAPHGDELVDDMTSIDFGKPKYYDITFSDGNTLLVHHDYILRYEHRTAPKLIKNGMLQGWGYAEGAHIINELMRDDKLKADITSLINKSLIEVIKMAGMRGVFMGADDKNQQQLQQRLEMVNWGRNFNSLTFLDKEDEYQMNTFSGLSGLADLLENNMLLISSALEMQGVLYGHLEKGMSSDNDAMERYDETINGRCESLVRPILTKLLRVLYIKCDIKDNVEFIFNSLLMKQHDKEKMEGLKSYQELLSSMLADGIITPRQYAESIQAYTTKGIIDFKFDDNALKKLDEDTMNQMEGIDLDGNEEEEEKNDNKGQSQTLQNIRIKSK